MDDQRTGLRETVGMIRNRIEQLESRQRMAEESTRIRLEGIGSNELTDSELEVMMKIMNDGGEDYSGQLLTMKKMIIGLAEYCIKTREEN